VFVIVFSYLLDCLTISELKQSVCQKYIVLDATAVVLTVAWLAEL